MSQEEAAASSKGKEAADSKSKDAKAVKLDKDGKPIKSDGPELAKGSSLQKNPTTTTIDVTIEELSEEDIKLKDELEMLVERLQVGS